MDSSEAGSASTGTPDGKTPPCWSVGDVSTSVDVLGFAMHVDALKRFLTHPETQAPLAVSIEGKWGTGKSSFMLQLRRAIDPGHIFRHHAAIRWPFSKKFSSPAHHSIWFNAWRHDKQESLWAAFALIAARELRVQVSAANRLRGDILLFCSRIKDLRSGVQIVLRTAFWWSLIFIIPAVLVVVTKIGASVFLPQDGRFLTPEAILASSIRGGIRQWSFIHWLCASIAVITTFIWTWTKTISNPLEIQIERYLTKPSYEQRIAFVENFHRDFGLLLQAYLGTKKLFAFIDDLDRCEDERVTELLQAINLLVGDDNRVIFIIGMDHSAVTRALEKGSKGKSLSEDTEQDSYGAPHTGDAYLEKFLQLPVRVPIADASAITRLVVSQQGVVSERTFESTNASRIVGRAAKVTPIPQAAAIADSPDVIRAVTILSDHLEHNPRRAKRLFNLTRFYIYLSLEQGLLADAGDFISNLNEHRFSIEQLSKLALIALKWPILLDKIIYDPRLLQTIAHGAEGKVSGEPTAESLVWMKDKELVSFLKEGTTIPGLVRRLSLASCDVRPLYYATTGRVPPKKFLIFQSPDSEIVIGHGDTEEEAWRDARERLGHWEQGDMEKLGISESFSFIAKS